MSISTVLEARIKKLEERVASLEAKLAEYGEEEKYMKALTQKAKEIITRDNKASVINLQKKMLIDLERARKIMSQLEKDGVVGPETGLGTRVVLVQK